MQRDVFIELSRMEQQILPSRYILIGVAVSRGASFARFLPATIRFELRFARSDLHDSTIWQENKEKEIRPR